MSTYFDIVPHCKLKFMLGDAKISIEWIVEEIHVGTNLKIHSVQLYLFLPDTRKVVEFKVKNKKNLINVNVGKKLLYYTSYLIKLYLFLEMAGNFFYQGTFSFWVMLCLP